MVAGGLRVIVCLGGFAWQALWPVLDDAGYALPRPAFAHGAVAELRSAGAAPVTLLGCYHLS